MNTIWGWLGLFTLILNYTILLKTHKYFFYIGIVGSLFYIIHSIITLDYSVLLVNLFLSVIGLIKIKQNQNI